MIPSTDPPENHPTPRPRVRWWRRRAFGLSTMMVLILLVGGMLGCWIRYVTRRTVAVATIEAAGGTILFRDDSHQPGGDWWAWLSRQTGIKELRTVGFVRLNPRNPILPTVRNPAFEPAPISEAFRALKDLGHVQYLDLSDCPIDPTNLEQLAGVRIDRLELRDSRAAMLLPDESLAAISRFGGVKHLFIDMHGAELPRGMLRALGGLNQLEGLTLRHRQAHPDRNNLEPLSHLRNLKVLDLPDVILDSDGMSVLDSLEKLRELDLSGARADDAALHRLVTHNPRLIRLAVDGSMLTDRGASALARLVDLQALALTGQRDSAGYLSDASLEVLGRLPKLEKIRMTSGRFAAAGLDALRGLPLRELELDSVGPGSEVALGRLVGGLGLHRLALAGPGITDAALPSLFGMFTRRISLDLSRSAVTDAGMVHLVRLDVQKLFLDDTAITDAGLAVFDAGWSLPELWARRTRITPAGATAFEALHPGVGRFTGTPNQP